jgi:negative regulator of sigma E activity
MMDTHTELELLSAYLDGELDAGERARLDAHVPACAECSETLQGLRATLTDLGTLPEPVLGEQESWALRSAILRARRASTRRQRFAWASGAAAAAVVAVVAIVATQGGSSNETATAPQKPVEALDASATVFSVDRNFDAASAHDELLAVAGAKTRSYSALSMPTPVAGPIAGGAPTQALPPSEIARRPAESTPELDHCVSVVRSSTQELLQAKQFEIARYEGKNAFLLFFATSARIELWVMSRPSCQVLYFAQAATS